ncbi:MAG: hypothetical protein ACI8RZ_001150 [Myxococcota bacterium]|jgi:hypothetical protein
MTALLALLTTAAFAEEPAEEESYPLVEVALEDVKIKRQEPISLPEEAAEIELPRVTCSMRVFIDPKGFTESVVVAGCPEEFHQTVHDSVMQWRFKSVKTADKEPARATFIMAVHLDLWASQSNGESEDGEDLD